MHAKHPRSKLLPFSIVTTLTLTWFALLVYALRIDVKLRTAISIMRCLSLLLTLGVLLPFDARGPLHAAGDLSALTDEQKAAGVGAVQDLDDTETEEPDRSKKNNKPCRDGWRFSDSFRNHDLESDDDLESEALGAVGTVAAAGVGGLVLFGASVLDPGGYVCLWNEDVPRFELSVNSMWYFESHSNHRLIVDEVMSNSNRLDWTGTPGFQTRIAVQPFHRAGFESIFEYASASETLQFANATDFDTRPDISFIPSDVNVSRKATLAVGQLNLLLRDETYNFQYAGLVWWHQDDLLQLRAMPNGASWLNETQSNAPHLQVGLQRAKIGRRWAWINRAGFGLGANWGTSHTQMQQVVGVVTPINLDDVEFSGIGEFKTELGIALNENLALSAGARFFGTTSGIRPSKQIDYMNIAAGDGKLQFDGLLFSSLHCGVHARF